MHRHANHMQFCATQEAVVMGLSVQGFFLSWHDKCTNNQLLSASAKAGFVVFHDVQAQGQIGLALVIEVRWQVPPGRRPGMIANRSLPK